MLHFKRHRRASFVSARREEARRHCGDRAEAPAPPSQPAGPGRTPARENCLRLRGAEDCSQTPPPPGGKLGIGSGSEWRRAAVLPPHLPVSPGRAPTRPPRPPRPRRTARLAEPGYGPEATNGPPQPPPADAPQGERRTEAAKKLRGTEEKEKTACGREPPGLTCRCGATAGTSRRPAPRRQPLNNGSAAPRHRAAVPHARPHARSRSPFPPPAPFPPRFAPPLARGGRDVSERGRGAELPVTRRPVPGSRARGARAAGGGREGRRRSVRGGGCPPLPAQPPPSARRSSPPSAVPGPPPPLGETLPAGFSPQDRNQYSEIPLDFQEESYQQ
ncbi:uncharacterized protein LOC142402696 isoform X2 [Mycteria americana]|uniref:uncharacterized protein LOC142402696 isoform X2 n=1 Tax=Mycteria americana TaxID=33587 RepID=UPI003F585E53